MLSEKAKKTIVKRLKQNRNWLKIQLTISIFGVTILNLTFPPAQEQEDVDYPLVQRINPNFNHHENTTRKTSK